MANTRRDFLRTAACALGGAALASTVESFGLLDAYAQSQTGYRALVCVFLNGGNDGNNMIVPLDQTSFNQYNSVRSGAGLALSQASLLAVNPPSQGRQFGFHPNMPEMQSLFNQGKLAVVCNTGPLVEPLTRLTYQNGTGKKPLQLFSHSDQVGLWQTSIANAVSQTGWGGRIADRMAAVNLPSTFSHSISINGVNTFLTGATARQLAIADASTALANILPLTMTGAATEVNARRAAFNQIRAMDSGARLVKAAADTRESALQTSAQLSQVALELRDRVPRDDSRATTLAGRPPHRGARRVRDEAADILRAGVRLRLAHEPARRGRRHAGHAPAASKPSPQRLL